MDKSLWGPLRFWSQFFLSSHLQSQSPDSLGSWKIPEVEGIPLLKSESGAQTPSPEAP